MRKFINISFLIISVLFVVSCESDIDNYGAASGGIYGTIYDKETNEPIPLPVQGSGGIQINMYEKNTEATASIDFRAKLDGTYVNTKIFEGDYRVQAIGPFAGVCEGYVTVKGQTQLDLYTVPFSRITIDAKVSTDNKITVDYDVTKTGDATHSITDISVIWNYAPGVDANSANYASIIPIGTSDNGTYVLDLMNDTQFIENHYKIVSNKNRIYVRVSATITVQRGSAVVTSAVNYSKVLTLIVNDIR